VTPVTGGGASGPGQEVLSGKENPVMRKLKLVAALCAIVLVTGCATAAGALIGAGIGRATGDTTAGVLIGSGIGMMIDSSKPGTSDSSATDR
jgi:hypothetical protein